MYRQALRSTPRAASALRQTVVRSAPRRFASTSPADKPRSWKGSALRWGLAGAALYYYNTSSVFADEAAPRTVPEPPHFADSDLKTVDAVIEEKRQKSPIKAEEPAPPPTPEASEAAPETTAQTTPEGETPQYEPGSPEALEAEAGQQGAFNPETGEINWDCPCLGGMADGPCGEEFKTAFSCFVYSAEEPKGIECIEKFQGMQECFRKYPEIYGAELADDEEAEGAAESAPTESSPSVNSDGDSVAAPEKVTPRAASEEEPFEEAVEKPAEKKTETKPETTTATEAAPKADKVILENAAEAAPAEAPKKFSDATDANKTA